MGWYCHPDTMSIAGAQHAAQRAIGNDKDFSSLAFKIAYRAAYEAENKGTYADSLASYLADLDKEIAWLESGKSQADYDEFIRTEDYNAAVKRFGIKCAKTMFGKK
jgi:hypothetical protein